MVDEVQYIEYEWRVTMQDKNRWKSSTPVSLVCAFCKCKNVRDDGWLSTILQLLILQGHDDLSKEQGINAPPDSVALLVPRESVLSLHGPTLSVVAQELLS